MSLAAPWRCVGGAAQGRPNQEAPAIESRGNGSRDLLSLNEVNVSAWSYSEISDYASLMNKVQVVDKGWAGV